MKKDREAAKNVKNLFGKQIRNRRLELGFSQEQFAFESGLHRNYIGSVERGERNISIENIYILAKALKCSPKELLP